MQSILMTGKGIWERGYESEAGQRMTVSARGKRVCLRYITVIITG